MDKKRSFIVVEGIVQGVGFRPFVYNLAKTFGLKGWVNNNSEGVYIDIEGFGEDIDKFVQCLENNPPPLARIEKITIKVDKVLNYCDFEIKVMLEAYTGIHVIRDATRGGVAAVLNEISEFSNVTIALEENDLPLKEEVKGATEMLGLDPLYIANEGKLCAFGPEAYAQKILSAMRKHPLGVEAAIIGKVTEELGEKVYLNTVVGGKRLVDMPSGIQLPRIC